VPEEIWSRLIASMRPTARPSFSLVSAELAIGEYPTPADARWLREEHHFGGVVCLQEDLDLARRGLELGELDRAYRAANIEFRHCPIADGDGDHLRVGLETAVAAVSELVDRGHRVYLHCTAGMNRAPTVAIAYLHVHRGHELEEAHTLVKSRRPCLPYMRALRGYYPPK
jgi:protein-tyrosine phosphatase